MTCGCRIIYEAYIPDRIIYCPLHAAAPKLLEAAKEISGNPYIDVMFINSMNKLKVAIAEAEKEAGE